MRKTITIAISAVSGGGKTTIIELLNKQITNSKALFFDDYHFEGSENFIDWVKRGADYNEWNLKPLIDDLSIILDNRISNVEYILLDYPFAYLNNAMKEFIDLTIFIDTPLDVALARRVLRDFSNATTEKILIDLQVYLSGAREAYMAMLNTVKPNSNVVIDGSLEKEVIVQKIKALIKKL